MIPMKLSELSDAIGAQYHGEDVTVSGISTDSRTVSENDLFVTLVGERFDAHDFLCDIKPCAAVCQRDIQGVDYPVLRVESTLSALGKIASFHAGKCSLSLVLSLTGSVGKTTTKEFCHLVLSKKFKTRKTEGNLNNHIGVPKTLLSLDGDDEALVCEMGMSARGEISYLTSLVKSDIAMITNIGHSHIENLKTRENIALAKLEIIEGLKKDGVLIVNGDEPLLSNPQFSGRIIKAGLSEECDIRAEGIETYPDRVEFDAVIFGDKKHVTLSVAGRHNVYNALFALAAGYAAGVDTHLAVESLLSYKPEGMRQNTYEKNGIFVIADCYNAGVESMCASLEALADMKGERTGVAVLGDMLELGEASERLHRIVGKKAAECRLDAVFAYGDAARFIALEAKEGGVGDVRFFDNKESCARELLEYTKKKSAILFKASRGMRCEEIISLSGLSKN